MNSTRCPDSFEDVHNFTAKGNLIFLKPLSNYVTDFADLTFQEIADLVRNSGRGGWVTLGYWKNNQAEFVLNLKNKELKDNWSNNDLVSNSKF